MWFKIKITGHENKEENMTYNQEKGNQYSLNTK